MDSFLLSCGAYGIYVRTVHKLRKACSIICMQCLFIKAYEVFELVIHLINTRLLCLLFYRCMSNKTQSYSRRLYNSSIAAVINGKLELVTEVLALPSYSLYAIDHPRLGVKQVAFVSLRIQPSHLAPCRQECFAGERSTTEISH